MSPEHVDVLIVGAGLSGIGAAYHLQTDCPQKSYAILEARESIGGTWDLFRYPGIRSDSDMYTLGYSFRPWEQAKAIADGPSILELRARHGQRARRSTATSASATASCAPSGPRADARWTVEATREDTGEVVQMTCSFLFMCTGYYRYDEGYTPEFAGVERFDGQIVHPQHWPEDLDYAGKRVVVIGSGATAVTLVPALAETRRARDDAAALAELRRVAARRRPDRQASCAACFRRSRLRGRALEERADDDARLPAQPPPARASSSA